MLHTRDDLNDVNNRFLRQKDMIVIDVDPNDHAVPLDQFHESWTRMLVCARPCLVEVSTDVIHHYLREENGFQRAHNTEHCILHCFQYRKVFTSPTIGDMVTALEDLHHQFDDWEEKEKGNDE